MFFLLRAIAIIAVIYHFSPVHEAGAPGTLAEAAGLSEAREGAARLDADAFDMAAIEERVLSALDDPRYEDWTAVPSYARDRLAIEIARQLADAALAPRPTDP